MRKVGVALVALMSLLQGAHPAGAAIMSLSFNPVSVPGGSSATGRVTISEPAPDGGLTVSLSSSTPAAVVPQRIVIPAGSNEATFTVGAAWIEKPTRVQIVATSIGRLYASGMGTLTFLPSGVTSVIFDPPNVVGGAPSVGTVLLSAPAPADGIAVQLAVTGPAAPPCSPPPKVPATVRVPAGAQRATFQIETFPSWEETFEIRASYAVTSASSALRVTKPWLKEVKVPARVRGGTTVQGVIQLAGPALPPGCGIKHRLASSDPSMAEVPADIVFPGGASEVAFEIKTAKVPSPYGVSLTATAFYLLSAEPYAESKETRIAVTPW
ncbi:MAG TPA: hypothetical protein VFR64_04080 [Methylomirabilota bacterium]|nr:hypothetical protein [Methylomirabilota bacterium]